MEQISNEKLTLFSETLKTYGLKGCEHYEDCKNPDSEEFYDCGACPVMQKAIQKLGEYEHSKTNDESIAELCQKAYQKGYKQAQKDMQKAVEQYLKSEHLFTYDTANSNTITVDIDKDRPMVKAWNKAVDTEVQTNKNDIL